MHAQNARIWTTSVVTGIKPELAVAVTVRVSLQGQPLTATAALVWSGDLPRPLQQVRFDAADGVTDENPEGYAAPVPVSA